ncbi:hypothetical protein ACFWP5_13960 [Streptomyces sp. NPDC058469]|uniref:hypothetical protein n=1 Tax=Streptomyces sp. NPDC058469 TaxID=3346514 RepID=UPI003648014F
MAADRAYGNGPCREYLRRRRVRRTIPENTDSQAARQRKGSLGGRPPGCDEEPYEERDSVERAINWLRRRAVGEIDLGRPTGVSKRVTATTRR